MLKYVPRPDGHPLRGFGCGARNPRGSRSETRRYGAGLGPGSTRRIGSVSLRTRERGGSQRRYIKFGAARSGSSFEALLDACETLAASKKLKRLIAGANAGREKAWQRLVARGFRADHPGCGHAQAQ